MPPTGKCHSQKTAITALYDHLLDAAAINLFIDDSPTQDKIRVHLMIALASTWKLKQDHQGKMAS